MGGYFAFIGNLSVLDDKVKLEEEGKQEFA